LIVENLFKPAVPSARQTKEKYAKGISTKRVAAGKEFGFDKANSMFRLKNAFVGVEVQLSPQLPLPIAKKFDNKPASGPTSGIPLTHTFQSPDYWRRPRPTLSVFGRFVGQPIGHDVQCLSPNGAPEQRE